MKGIDFLIGIKSEQTLRDAVRGALDPTGQTEASDDPQTESTPTTALSDPHASQLELCPIGKKDWIAGHRVESPLRFGDLATHIEDVTKELIELQSHQRIRRDSVRIHAVAKPVPVFKEVEPQDEPTPPVTNEDEVVCPACGAKVHNYNIRYDPWGKMVGCYLCRSGG